MRKLLFLSPLLATLSHASQPTAPKPVPAPMRDLPWGQLNILATTDTHGWHGGHLLEPQYSADFGDLISFSHHMRRIADSKNVDLLIIDTGDRVDGNGLYDASTPKGLYTSEIVKHMPYDILCAGNHELYKTETVEREYNVTVPNFPDSYLASNLDIAHPVTGERTPLSRRYKITDLPATGLRVLSFGFLFDFALGAPNVYVTSIHETVESAWFQEAVKREDIDIFIVIGHVAPRGREWKMVQRAIRKWNWDAPILFLSGHSHVRDFVKLDGRSVALQSGRYVETVGWLSVDGVVPEKRKEKHEKETREAVAAADNGVQEEKKGVTFGRRYIDANLYSYTHHTNLSEAAFHTPFGHNITTYITRARTALDLDTTFGCAPRTYFANSRPYPHPDSLYSLVADHLLPSVLNEGLHGNPDHLPSEVVDRPKIGVMNTGGLRFDIFKGRFTRDSILIMSPFDNQWKTVRGVRWGVARKILPLINAGGEVLGALSNDERGNRRLESWRLAPVEQVSWREDRVVEERRDEGGQEVLGEREKLIPGYTTEDDMGCDGDDTVHSPVSYYRVPNAIQAEINFPAGKKELDDDELVDVVFLDYVQPWVLLAMRFAGKEYGKGDVAMYMAGKGFTSMIEEWVRENWGGNCGGEEL